MSVATYPTYRESDADWLGLIPDHWQTQTGRRLFQQRRDPPLVTDEQLSATQKYGVVPQSLFMELEDQKVTLALSGLENFKHVEPDDFVISLRSFQGGIEWSKYRGCVSPAYTVLRSTRVVQPKYWSYLLRSKEFIGALNAVTQGIRDGKNISYDQFGSLLLPLPSYDEQKDIVEFLDYETAKIDALAEEQRRLIALLKEKRQSIISHAVTKGLDPTSTVKDSGVEWLGDVPAHWRVCRLKRAFGSVTYGISDAVSSEGSVAILRMGNIANGSVLLEDLKYTDEVEPDLLLEQGDLLYNRTNSLDLIGKVGLFLGSGDAPVSFASYLVRLRLRDGSPEFFSFLLNTDGILGLARASAFVSIGQCNLNPTKYGEIIVALPPLKEQVTIARYLIERTGKLDALMLEAKSAIKLLQERRAALISAAVTGKIDVRGLIRAEAEAA